jgi:hypothetical protein
VERGPTTTPSLQKSAFIEKKGKRDQKINELKSEIHELNKLYGRNEEGQSPNQEGSCEDSCPRKRDLTTEEIIPSTT